MTFTIMIVPFTFSILSFWDSSIAAWIPTYSPAWTPAVISIVFPVPCPCRTVAGSRISPFASSSSPLHFFPGCTVIFFRWKASLFLPVSKNIGEVLLLMISSSVQTSFQTSSSQATSRNPDFFMVSISHFGRSRRLNGTCRAISSIFSISVPL